MARRSDASRPSLGRLWRALRPLALTAVLAAAIPVIGLVIDQTSASGAIAPSMTWSQAASSGPSARYGASMAYDPKTSQLVLFGGYDGVSLFPFNDTWVWSGSAWSQVDDGSDPGCTTFCTSSPTGRSGATMAWDPATSQLVLFGGNAGGYQNDTWTWNGSTWSQVSSSGPVARAGASMAWDAATSQLILFGGDDGTSSSSYFNDTWNWNGSAWSQVDGSGCNVNCTNSPPVRTDAAMDYDGATWHVIVFGGANTTGELNDTYYWTGSVWSLGVNPIGCTNACFQSPSAREYSDFTWDPATAQMLLFGGFTGSAYANDTWTWGGNGSGWSNASSATNPSGRSSAAMAYDPATSQMVLFGGYAGSALADTWTWGDLPGAASSWGELLSATCTTSCPNSPPARQSPSMAFDPASSQMVLFGGHPNGNGELNDTWNWNGSAWGQFGGTVCTTSCASSPPGRESATMAWDPATSQLMLFGGFSGSGELNDTWTWSGSAWSQVDGSGCTNNCTNSPPVRDGATMTYDPATSQMVLFGGFDGSVHRNDTWTWSGSAWSQVDGSGCSSNCTNSPPGRSNATMEYDPATSKLVLFGGSNGSPLNDTWTWNGSTWGQVDGSGCTTNCTNSPPDRAFATTTYDPATSGFVLFGGAATAFVATNDTWAWNGSTWGQVDGSGCTTSCTSSPLARYNQAMAYDPASTQLLVFAGSTSSGTELDDTWAFMPTVVAPGAPSIGSASAGNGNTSVSFTAPTTSGGGSISSYTVTATDLTNAGNGGEAAGGAASPITITGLTNGDVYTFTVSASNAAGSGPASSPTPAVTPAAPPTPTTTAPTTTTTTTVAPVITTTTFPVVHNSAPSPPKPSVSLSSTSLAVVLKNDKPINVPVGISCAHKSCAVSATLDKITIVEVPVFKTVKGKRVPVLVLVHGKLVQKTVPTPKPVAIGSASVTIASGKSKTLSVVLNTSGVQQLSTATSKKPVTGDEVVVTVHGGSTLTKSVKIG